MLGIVIAGMACDDERVVVIDPPIANDVTSNDILMRNDEGPDAGGGLAVDCTAFYFQMQPPGPCPESKPFCCYYVDLFAYCEQTFSSTCRETPHAGSESDCDSSTGSGCAGDMPVCCATGNLTYCTDHALAGWECSQ